MNRSQALVRAGPDRVLARPGRSWSNPAQPRRWVPVQIGRSLAVTFLPSLTDTNRFGRALWSSWTRLPRKSRVELRREGDRDRQKDPVGPFSSDSRPPSP